MADQDKPPKKRPIDASKDQEQGKQKKIEFERISAEELQRRTADEADKSALKCVFDRCSSKVTDARKERLEQLKRRKEQVRRSGLVQDEAGQRRDDVSDSPESDEEGSGTHRKLVRSKRAERDKDSEGLLVGKKQQRRIDDDDGIVIEDEDGTQKRLGVRVIEEEERMASKDFIDDTPVEQGPPPPLYFDRTPEAELHEYVHREASLSPPASDDEESSSSSSESESEGSNASKVDPSKDEDEPRFIREHKVAYSEPLQREESTGLSESEDKLALERDRQRLEMEKHARDLERQRSDRRNKRAAAEEEGRNITEDEVSNSMSNLGDAAAAVLDEREVEHWSARLAKITSNFKFADFQAAMTEGAPSCYLPKSDNCNRCLRYKIANAYMTEPVKMMQLLNAAPTAGPLTVKGVDKPAESQPSSVGKKSKTLLAIYKEKNAVDINPSESYLDSSKYPWRIIGLISPKERPNLKPVTQRPKEKFAPIPRKAINGILDSTLLPLINAGRLEAAHFTIIPDLDFSNLNEKARLKAYTQVPIYWEKLYNIMKEDESVVWAWVNMEVHPATKKKNDKDSAKTQEQLEQEQEEDKVRGDNQDPPSDAEDDIPENATEAEKRRIEAANNVKIAKKDKKKKAELVEKIVAAIEEIDKTLIPLLERKESGNTLTEDEEKLIKKLEKERRALEKSRPNILAGFPHYEVFVVRDKRLVPADQRVSTFYYMQQKIQATGARDTCIKRVFKRKGKADSSVKNDLTFEARYPLIAHNCNTAIENLRAAGFIVDGKRGVAWQYYNESELLPENWHLHFKNMVAEISKVDGISLSDEADKWKTVKNLTALNEAEAGDEELLIERIAAYMKREGLFLYINNRCILRRKEGSMMSAEIVYSTMDQFIRKLTTVPMIKKDLLKKMNFLDEKYVRRYGDLPRIDLCFEAVELADGYFIMDSRKPSEWGSILRKKEGFIAKNSTFEFKDGRGAITAYELIRQRFVKMEYFLWFCDLNMTMEQMKEPPVNWLKAMSRYFPAKDEEKRRAQFHKMAELRDRIQVAKEELLRLTKSKFEKKAPKKTKGKEDHPSDNHGINVDYMRYVKIQEKEKDIKELEEMYNRIYVWEQDKVGEFFLACMHLLFVPTHRQRSMFLVGETGAGKTIALCWAFGKTKATKVISNVEETEGLYHQMNVATFGGNFSMASIEDGVTRICIVQEMTASRAKIADMLTFLEHGQVEAEKKFKDRAHEHAGFAKAFTGNKMFNITNEPAVTEAARDRFVHFYMNKQIEDHERDYALESKVRKEKFNIVYYLVTRRWDEEFWANDQAADM